MANWNNPVNTTSYLSLLGELKGRDEDVATMFDVGSPTNIPTNSVRWNSANNRFEKYNGATYDVLSSSYAINVTQLGGIGSTGYLRLTTGGSQTFSAGGLTIDGNVSAGLILKGGTANSVYISLYANAAAQSTRTGYLGFGGVADATFYIVNEYSNGDIFLNAAGTGRVRISDTLVLQSTSLVRNSNTSVLHMYGGNGVGSFISLYGDTHATQAHDVEITAGSSSRIFFWDENAGTLTLRTGTGAKTDAAIFGSTQDLTLSKSLTVGGSGTAGTFIDIKSSSTGDPTLNLKQTATTRGFLRYLNSSAKVQLSGGTSIGLDLIVNNSTTALSIASNGVATFSSTVNAGAISGTSITSSDKVEGDYIRILQKASQAGAATFGTLWVKNTSPTVLHYVDSGGNDFRISPNTTVTGHKRAGNRQTRIAATDPATFNVIANLNELAFETIGPTGSGAQNIYSEMDVMPTNATHVIVYIYAEGTTDFTAPGDIYIYATDGDSTDSRSKAANEVMQMTVDPSTTGRTQSMGQLITIPVNSSRVFRLQYWLSDINTAEVCSLYYRGFLTD